MNLCLRPASCPYRLYPYDTLCTYGVKQLKLLGFSQRHLFWCSLMASSTLLDTILSFSVLSTAFRKQTFIEFAVPKQSTVQRTQVQNL